jgi:hypothetical protein
MKTESQLLASSPCTTQERSDSTDRLIREWLFRFGVNFKEDIAPILLLWLEAFGGMDPETLDKLFRRAIRTCKFFPRVADILEPVNGSTIGQAGAELKWTQVLDFIRKYWSPDLPGGISRGAPRITERTMTAIRAAGGLAWINECTREQMVWAKKNFLESYTAWATLERDQYLLPDDSPIKALLSGACKALPAPGDNWPELRVRSLAYAEALAAADDLPEPRPPRIVIAEPKRYAELAKQAAEMVAKYASKADQSA